MPHEYLYVWLTLLVLAAAAACTAHGLDSARQFGEATSRRVIGVVLGILAVLSTAGTAATFMSSPQASIDGVLTVIGLATNLIVTLAWIYLFTVALGGWMARERPLLAWGLAALGTGLYLVLDLLIGAIDFIALPAGTDVLILAVTILDLGWVALLLAFVAGLPAVRADPREATQPGSEAG
jgi:hypothetical protein